MSTPVPSDSVRFESAYSAALTRAQRTTEALILAEARIIELHERCALADSRIFDLERRVEELAESGDAEPGEEEGDGDPVGYTTAVGQAD